MAGMSEGQVAVYDRQLRLWGVQAQQRLLKAKVLIWGLEGCNVEVAKNLVLAGVSLVIHDHRSVGSDEVACNYFLRGEDVGQNRAECAARRIQEMNPLCSVTAGTSAPPAAGDAAALRELLKGFDTVCLSLGILGFDAAGASAVDAACREVGSQFILTVGCGEMAFFFTDLNEHCVMELSSAQGGAGQTAPQAQAGPAETLQFASLQEWLGCAPEDLVKGKVDSSVVLVALFLAFSRHSGPPSPEGANKFEDYCRSVAKCEPKVDGFASLKDAYELFFLEPLVHVASVVGGLLAQEVIKAITKRDQPLQNTVCFNAHTNIAIVEHIPAPQKKAVKRKIEECGDLLD